MRLTPLRLTPILIFLGISILIGTHDAPTAAPYDDTNCRQSIGKWRKVSDAPYTHIEGGGAVVDGKLYALSGYANNVHIPEPRVDVYNIETDTWETAFNPRRPMPVAITHNQSVAVDQYIWMVGGFLGPSGGPPTDQVWKYDTVFDKWYEGPSLPEPRASGALVRHGRTLHYFGGLSFDRNTDYADHWTLRVDKLEEGWQEAPPMPQPRNHFNGVEIDGIIYAVGGQFNHDDDPTDVNLLHAYDTTTQVWEQRASLPMPRSHAEMSILAVNGRIIVIGGRNNQDGEWAVYRVTEYNPATDTWTQLRRMLFPLLTPNAAYHDGMLVYTFGGYDYLRGSKETFVATLETNCQPDLDPIPTVMAIRTLEPRETAVALMSDLLPFPTAIPATAQLYAPGENQIITQSDAAFMWQDVADTMRYKLVIRRADDGQRVAKVKLNAASAPSLRDACTDGLCQVSTSQIGTALEPGTYQWFVVTKNDAGKSKSTRRSFTIE